jgi:hypothetical protein
MNTCGLFWSRSGRGGREDALEELPARSGWTPVRLKTSMFFRISLPAQPRSRMTSVSLFGQGEAVEGQQTAAPVGKNLGLPPLTSLASPSNFVIVATPGTYLSRFPDFCRALGLIPE